MNEAWSRQLARADARLDGLYVCTHHPSEGRPPFRADCECRKPKPGLLLRAAADLGLDLARSTMVGDKPSDLGPGSRAVGAGAVLVLTGYGLGEWEYRRAAFEVEPDHVAADLLDAVDWALARRAGGVSDLARRADRGRGRFMRARTVIVVGDLDRRRVSLRQARLASRARRRC